MKILKTAVKVKDTLMVLWPVMLEQQTIIRTELLVLNFVIDIITQ